MAKTKIVILETNQVFDSIAAAARSVGVDASNARKAVLGKRASAGGYHFAAMDQSANSELFREQIREAVREKEKRKVLTKAERNQRNNLLNNVHDLLVDVNKRARNAKKEGLYNTDPVLQKMTSYSDFIGMNKTGGYDTSLKNLRTFSNEELQNVAAMIERDKGEYAKNIYDRQSRHRNLASYAAQFGISNAEAAKYFELYPVLFELFSVAKQNTEYNYSDVTGELYDAMQGGATEDELLDFVLDLKTVYQGNTKEDLDAILKKWSKERKKWQENWETKKKFETKWGNDI